MKKRKKYPIVYAFIDSQNLNLGTSKDIYRNKKLYKIIAPSRKSESSLIKRFRDYKLYAEDIRPKVEFKPKKTEASH